MESRVHLRHVGDRKTASRCKRDRDDRATETPVTATRAASSIRVQAAQRDGPEVTRGRTRGSNAERGVVSQPVIVEVNKGWEGEVVKGEATEQALNVSNVRMSGEMGGGDRLQVKETAGGLWVVGLLGTGMSGESSFAFSGLILPDRSASLF